MNCLESLHEVEQPAVEFKCDGNWTEMTEIPALVWQTVRAFSRSRFCNTVMIGFVNAIPAAVFVCSYS